jgi:FHS family L-fucose permease-like MFS transporter
MKFFEPRKLMGLYGLINIVLVGIAVIYPGWIGVWAIFLTSFFMSLMFPTIFALGIKGLGPHTKIAGSMIVMAIVGGAVLTPLMGMVATKSMAIAMLYPLACYVVVTFYAYRGSIPKNIIENSTSEPGIISSH